MGGGFPKPMVPFWGPRNEDDYTLGYLEDPCFWETTI